MLIAFPYQELGVIQFSQVLNRNYWEFEMSDWVVAFIFWIIIDRHMNFFKKVSNRNVSNAAKFGVCSIYCFWAIEKIWAGDKNDPPPSG